MQRSLQKGLFSDWVFNIYLECGWIGKGGFKMCLSLVSHYTDY